jgi:hypothetical protein
MHWITVLLPLVASAAILQERQASNLGGVDELKPQFRKGARRTLTKIGRMLFSLLYHAVTNFDSLYTESSRMKIHC